MPNYEKTLTKAKNVKKNVEKEQKLGEATSWGYYFAKEILKPKSNLKQISIKSASNPKGNDMSRQIWRSTYTKLAEDFVKYVEKEYELPNNLSFTTQTGKTLKIALKDLIYMFARIVVFYNKENKYPKYAELNTKIWIKETETGNVVFDYFVKKTGFKPTCLDDVCDYIRDHFDYEFYYDDYKSNKEVIDSRAGNCTDLLQFLVNMAEALGYEWKIIHTECKQSGVGHVYGMFRKNSDYFVRDIACIADESRYCVWCEVPNGGYKLAENPYWFLQNIHR